ncbi:NACHT domain-containing protein [Sphingomonas sp. URHD0057]|uniref:NACHT domain-containing protein n=1 Tax=Sphingomonas sp. URHD0057 TaxID=1380389 RepID=UPI0012DE0FF9|nr:hypothetical protein [Sphingomonas sp. URHD0057]
MTQPLVIVGDAGMGKTRLLQWLGDQPGFRFVTARQLLNHPKPRDLLGNAGTLVIDALDEVAGQNDGDAVDFVLRKVGELDRPRFVLSCRVADWRSATGLTAITELYEDSPLELYLDPLDSEQAREFLSGNPKIGAERARQVADQLAARGFSEWLGNPQTLLMLEPLLEDGEPPASTAALFEQYVDRVWKEHSEKKAQTALNASNRDEVLDALGAAFAALILANKTGVYRGSAANARESDLPLAEVAKLPGAAKLDQFAASRLLRIDHDRLSYQHRRIGEYLGAQWLAKRSDTPRKRQRLLSLFRSTNNLVPAHLRGLHAWLAWHDHELANDVFRADPMGVIEYGDADTLTSKQACALLASLERLSERNPRFRGWGEYRARGLVQLSTFAAIRKILADKSRPFNLRMTLIEQLDSAELAAEFSDQLVALLRDESVEYAIRYRSGEVLSKHDTELDWPAEIEALRVGAKADSVRLAAELLAPVGLDKFSDQLIVETLLADAGLTICAIPREKVPDRAARFFIVKRNLPSDRAEGVLDCLSAFATTLIPRDGGIEHNELIDFAYELVLDRLALGPIEPKKLWSWLEPYEELHGYSRDNRDRLSAWLKDHDVERRAIQRYVLLERPGKKTVWERAWRLVDVMPGLAPTHSDAVELLGRLDASKQDNGRWRDLVNIVRHDGEIGAEVRDAAKPFAEGDPDAAKWLAEIATPAKPEWQIRQEQRQARQTRERKKKWAEHRQHFAEHRDAIRAGDANFLLSPAQAYLGLFSDIERDGPPIDRVRLWLGDDLSDDVLVGLDAFLHADISKPTPEEISASYVAGRHWRAAHIIVVALAEHEKAHGNFAGVPVDRLVAGRLELEQHGFGRIDGSQLPAQLDAALRATPGAYERYLRLLVEPSLRSRRTYVPGLYQVMRTPLDSGLADSLASEWLSVFPRVAGEVEEELIDRLIRAGEFEKLQAVATRRARNKLDERRSRDWRAVRLLTDFEKESALARGVATQDRDFLWTLRARFGGRRDSDGIRILPVRLAAWIVREFRAAFPLVGHPTGVSSGDTNPWDASDYLAHLIGRIGEEVSDEAIALLSGLMAIDDSYTEYLRSVSAEQASKRADQDHQSPSIDDIKAIVNDGPPRFVEDLQRVVVEELDRVQSTVRADDVDSWKGFYADTNPSKLQPKHEEDCSDYLITLLRQNRYGLEFTPEPHLAADREGDIGCSIGGLWLPIEAKGQWNPDLWTAADNQLQAQQSCDHRAANRGIYLVYWFGVRGKRLTKPPNGISFPNSPAELEQALTENSAAAQSGRIIVKVLDVSR